MANKKPAKERGMKTPKGQRPEAPKGPKVPRPYRKDTWETKSKWESDDLGSGYK